MGELRTHGFHHVTMVSSDARRTLRFYRDLLGLRLVKRTVNYDDPGAHHLYFGDRTGRPGTILTFFEWPHARRGGWGVGGVHHVALGVTDVDALLRWKRRLVDGGVDVSGPYDRGYFTSLYFRDPDGQILELATRGPGYAIDEPADALGQALVEPPRERLRGHRDEAAIRALTHPEPVPEITDDLRIERIHHVSGITGDLDRAGAFLTDALGLRLVKRTYNQDDARTPHYFWAHYEEGRVAPGSAYTLFGWPGSTYHARGGVGQTHHVAFRAADADEQLEWREHLISLGIEVSPVMERVYFRSIYFRAPDGMLFEIATDGPGFLVDEGEGELGRRLVLPEWLEHDRETIESSLTPLDERRVSGGNAPIEDDAPVTE